MPIRRSHFSLLHIIHELSGWLVSSLVAGGLAGFSIYCFVVMLYGDVPESVFGLPDQLIYPICTLLIFVALIAHRAKQDRLLFSSPLSCAACTAIIVFASSTGILFFVPVCISDTLRAFCYNVLFVSGCSALVAYIIVMIRLVRDDLDVSEKPYLRQCALFQFVAPAFAIIIAVFVLFSYIALRSWIFHLPRTILPDAAWIKIARNDNGMYEPIYCVSHLGNTSDGCAVWAAVRSRPLWITSDRLFIFFASGHTQNGFVVPDLIQLTSPKRAIELNLRESNYDRLLPLLTSLDASDSEWTSENIQGILLLPDCGGSIVHFP